MVGSGGHLKMQQKNAGMYENAEKANEFYKKYMKK